MGPPLGAKHLNHLAKVDERSRINARNARDVAMA